MSSPASPTTTAPTPTAIAVSAPPVPGRLAVMAAYAVGAAAIPIPFLPARVLLQVRGAVVYDIASRHGLSLTSDARAILANPTSDPRVRMLRAAETVARTLFRRVVTLKVLDSAVRAFEVFALGTLLERYVSDVRSTSAVRINTEEALLVRDAIDRAVVRALSPSLRPTVETIDTGVEDLRDEFTRWIDAILLTGAAVPGYIERRLSAAFAQVVAETPGFRGTAPGSV